MDGFVVHFLVGSRDKTSEQGVRCVGFALELGMELGGDEERVVGDLNDFDQLIVRGCARENHAGGFVHFPVLVVKFVPVTVAFRYLRFPVEGIGEGVGLDGA